MESRTAEYLWSYPATTLSDHTGRIAPEWWTESNRNAGRIPAGTVDAFPSESWPDSSGIRTEDVRKGDFSGRAWRAYWPASAFRQKAAKREKLGKENQGGVGSGWASRSGARSGRSTRLFAPAPASRWPWRAEPGAGPPTACPLPVWWWWWSGAGVVFVISCNV